MFDTIVFLKPIQCKECGADITSTQTKQFDNFMTQFEVGDILPGRMITGIIEESIYCKHLPLEGKKDLSFDQKIFLVIYRNILIGVTESYELAEKQVNKFGFGELFLLYQDLHKKRDLYQAKYSRLRTWCTKYASYLNMDAKKKEGLEDMKGLEAIQYSSLFPYVKVMNPLKEYIDELDEQNELNKSNIFF